MIPEPQTQFTYYSLGIHSGNKGWMCGKLLLQELSPFKKPLQHLAIFLEDCILWQKSVIKISNVFKPLAVLLKAGS